LLEQELLEHKSLEEGFSEQELLEQQHFPYISEMGECDTVDSPSCLADGHHDESESLPLDETDGDPGDEKKE